MKLNLQNSKWAINGYEQCRSEALESVSDTLEPLSVSDVLGCFILLSIGISAASISFLIELSNRRGVRAFKLNHIATLMSVRSFGAT